jgi:hypothetical protein
VQFISKLNSFCVLCSQINEALGDIIGCWSWNRGVIGIGIELIIHTKKHRWLEFPLWTSNQEYQESSSRGTYYSHFMKPLLDGILSYGRLLKFLFLSYGHLHAAMVVSISWHSSIWLHYCCHDLDIEWKSQVLKWIKCYVRNSNTYSTYKKGIYSMTRVVRLTISLSDLCSLTLMRMCFSNEVCYHMKVIIMWCILFLVNLELIYLC